MKAKQDVQIRLIGPSRAAVAATAETIGVELDCLKKKGGSWIGYGLLESTREEWEERADRAASKARE